MRTLFALTVLTPVLCLAQRTTAQLTGSISDATGASVPNARIEVISTETGFKRAGASNELGYYSVPLLPPGEYRVTVQLEGFRSIARTGVRLEVDQVARLDFTLEVGSLAEAVEVTESVSMARSMFSNCPPHSK